MARASRLVGFPHTGCGNDFSAHARLRAVSESAYLETTCHDGACEASVAGWRWTLGYVLACAFDGSAARI
jgi:hypothetical protein